MRKPSSNQTKRRSYSKRNVEIGRPVSSNVVRTHLRSWGRSVEKTSRCCDQRMKTSCMDRCGSGMRSSVCNCEDMQYAEEAPGAPSGGHSQWQRDAEEPQHHLTQHQTSTVIVYPQEYEAIEMEDMLEWTYISILKSNKDVLLLADGLLSLNTLRVSL